MAGEIVQELYSLLGLKVDQESWAAGNKFLGAVQAGFAAVVAGFGIAQIEHMVSTVADLADTASKSAQKLGISTEAVQELGYAAKLANVEQGELEESLTHLAKNLDDVATTGKGPAADALKRLKISAKELKGESLDQNLEVIANAFQKLPDGPAKASLAMDLFGKSGGKLIPLLNSGQAGIVELRNEAQKLGIVVSTDTAKKFEDFNDAQSKLGATWQGLKTQVVSALLPALAGVVDKFQAWIDTHRELISSGLTAVVNGLTVAFDGVAKAIDIVAKVIEFFRQNSEVAESVIQALAIGLGVLAVKAAIAWVAAAGPVLAYTAVLTGLILVVKDVYKSITTGKGKAADAWNALKDQLGPLASAAATAGVAIAAAFGPVGIVIAGITAGIAVIIAKWDQIKDIGNSIGKSIDWNPEKIQDQMRKQAEAGGAGSVPMDQLPFGLSAPAQTVPSGMPASLSAAFGGVSIAIQSQPGMNEERLAQIAGIEVEKAQRRMLGDAFDALRGGVK